MRSVMKYVPKTTKTWEMPSSVVAVTVEKETWPAKLPSEYTPDDMKITEYFKKVLNLLKYLKDMLNYLMLLI